MENSLSVEQGLLDPQKTDAFYTASLQFLRRMLESRQPRQAEEAVCCRCHGVVDQRSSLAPSTELLESCSYQSSSSSLERQDALQQDSVPVFLGRDHFDDLIVRLLPSVDRPASAKTSKSLLQAFFRWLKRKQNDRSVSSPNVQTSSRSLSTVCSSDIKISSYVSLNSQKRCSRSFLKRVFSRKSATADESKVKDCCVRSAVSETVSTVNNSSRTLYLCESETAVKGKANCLSVTDSTPMLHSKPFLLLPLGKQNCHSAVLTPSVPSKLFVLNSKRVTPSESLTSTGLTITFEGLEAMNGNRGVYLPVEVCVMPVADTETAEQSGIANGLHQRNTGSSLSVGQSVTLNTTATCPLYGVNAATRLEVADRKKLVNYEENLETWSKCYTKYQLPSSSKVLNSAGVEGSLHQRKASSSKTASSLSVGHSVTVNATATCPLTGVDAANRLEIADQKKFVNYQESLETWSKCYTKYQLPSLSKVLNDTGVEGSSGPFASSTGRRRRRTEVPKKKIDPRCYGFRPVLDYIPSRSPSPSTRLSKTSVWDGGESEVEGFRPFCSFRCTPESLGMLAHDN